METKANLVEEEENIWEEMDTVEEAGIIEKTDSRQMGRIKERMVQITKETRNHAVLASSGKRSVVGMPWL